MIYKEIPLYSELKEKNDILSKEIISLKEENNKLKNDLQKANKTIQNLINQQNLNNNSNIELLKKEILLKENKINLLKIELEDIKNKDNDKFVNFKDIIVISITSQDQIINKHPIKCLKTDIFAEIEEKLYQQYENYNFRDTNNTFIVNGAPILRYKKLYENKIKDGDNITLIKPQ